MSSAARVLYVNILYQISARTRAKNRFVSAAVLGSCQDRLARNEFLMENASRRPQNSPSETRDMVCQAEQKLILKS